MFYIKETIFEVNLVDVFDVDVNDVDVFKVDQQINFSEEK
jgi:hypothetical protein